MRRIVSLSFVLMAALTASSAFAATPHLGRDVDSILTYDTGGQYLFLPHGQNVGATTFEMGGAFQLGQEGNRAVKASLYFGAGATPSWKAYLVYGGDVSYIFSLVKHGVGAEIGGRLWSMAEFNDDIGYDNGVGLGPYANLLIPARGFTPGMSDVMYVYLGGGGVLAHLEANHLYGMHTTGFFPFVQLGMGFDLR